MSQLRVDRRVRGLAQAAMLLLLLAFMGLSGCARTPPEQRLRERIAQMQEALEARNRAVGDAWLQKMQAQAQVQTPTQTQMQTQGAGHAG